MNDRHYVILQPPQPAGYMQLFPGFRVYLPARPRWFYRKTMRAVFGWEWADS